jgi:hypothetical protein
MGYAAADLIPLEDDLAVLTDEIFSEIGNRDRLVDEKARAEAIARVGRLLARAILHPAEPTPDLTAEDLAADIAFGRMDAEYAFEDRPVRD